ncbi:MULTISPECIES: PsiF family protein [Pseudomonas aeruginosa group]
MSGCLKAGAPAGGKATAQQEKMKSCNADASAKALKGDERKAFMSSCLKAGGGAKAATQQEKMKTCNADATAKALKGDERKAFMSTCLKK